MLIRPNIGWNSSKLTFTLVYQATGIDTSVEIPSAGATAAVGDFAILFNQGDGGGPPSLVVGSGWSNSINDSTANSRAIINAKILTSEDLGSSLTAMNGSTEEKWMLLIFRPSKLLTGFSSGTFVSDSTSGNPTPQVIASAAASSLPIIVVGFWTEPVGSINPRTMTPAMTIEYNVDAHFYVQYIIYNYRETPVNHTIDQDDHGTNNIIEGGWYEFET